MRWKNIRLILTREVRDQLRDRRTLFMMLVLPIVLYPALGIGMMQMILLFQEQPRTVVVLGAKNLPQVPPLIRDGRFVDRWFRHADDASKLTLLTDEPEESPAVAELPPGAAVVEPAPVAVDPKGEAAEAKRARMFDLAAALRPLLAERARLEEELARAEEAKDAVAVRKAERNLGTHAALLAERFAETGIQVLIFVPEGFAARLEADGRDPKRAEAAPSQRLQIVFNKADDKSGVAQMRVKEVVSAWEKEILRERLTAADLPATWTTPVNADQIDLAATDQISAGVWSKIFPALLVIWAVTGAFYPAIDLAAGEKERGTMETLLICPAKRSEIVLGKFLTVMLFSVTTAVLNLASMGVTSKYLASMTTSGALSKLGGDLQPPPIGAILWVIALLLPLSALFSALCLSLATFARSTKEGQYYLTPLLMIVMGLTVFCLSPGIEITPFYSVTPVVGVALLLKQVLSSPGSPESFFFAAPVLLTSVGYAFLALWWAIEQFSREDVLFREAERIDPKLWLQHLMRDKEPTPSFAEAVLCFAAIMLLNFGAMKFMQDRLQATPPELYHTVMMQLLMIQQLAIIATPALLMGVMLTTSVRRTLLLFWPKAGTVAAAAVLAVCLHVLTLEFMTRFDWFFPALPESVRSAVGAMSSDRQPTWFVLLAFAAAPAICEELAFRGFILSGFRRSGRTGLAILFSSATFGLMHMIPQQVFNATLLGLALGLIAVRTGSLLPGIAFHAVYNGLQVLRTRADAAALKEGPAGWVFAFDPAGKLAGYSPLALMICAVGAALLLGWFAGRGDDGAERRPIIGGWKILRGERTA